MRQQAPKVEQVATTTSAAQLRQEVGMRAATQGRPHANSATLAELLTLNFGSLRSVDHVSPGSGIIACDIASVPLESAVLDVAIPCLAPMDSNCTEYIRQTPASRQGRDNLVKPMRDRRESTRWEDSRDR